MIKLFCKRAKIFMESNRRFIVRPNVMTNCPDWVRDTGTYKNGVNDESIIDASPKPATGGTPQVAGPTDAELEKAQQAELLKEQELEKAKEATAAKTGDPTDEELEKAQQAELKKSGGVKGKIGNSTLRAS